MPLKKDELHKIARIWSEIDCFLEVTSEYKDHNFYVLQGKKYTVNALSIKTLLKYGYISIDMNYNVPDTVRYEKKKDFIYSEYIKKNNASYWRDDYHYNYAANRRRASRREGDNVPR